MDAIVGPVPIRAGDARNASTEGFVSSKRVFADNNKIRAGAPKYTNFFIVRSPLLLFCQFDLKALSKSRSGNLIVREENSK